MATSKIVIIIDQNLLYRLDFLVKSQRFTKHSHATQKAVARVPLTLELQESNFPKHFCAKTSQIRTLSVKRLLKKISVAKPEEINLIRERLNEEILCKPET